jgi:ribosomal protein L37AE/L43A
MGERAPEPQTMPCSQCGVTMTRRRADYFACSCGASTEQSERATDRERAAIEATANSIAKHAEPMYGYSWDALSPQKKGAYRDQARAAIAAYDAALQESRRCANCDDGEYQTADGSIAECEVCDGTGKSLAPEHIPEGERHDA